MLSCVLCESLAGPSVMIMVEVRQVAIVITVLLFSTLGLFGLHYRKEVQACICRAPVGRPGWRAWGVCSSGGFGSL